ncbi:MAG: hypothetical protein ACI845_001115 [Gammaproteobacteria bacterium]|jgi:uncharacterized protein (DUF58 family)
MALLKSLLPSSIRRKIDGWIAQHNPPSREGITLHNRRLYILPTRFGYLFAVMLLFLFLAAINYQNSMAFVLTFMLTALGIVSLWKTHGNILNLKIELQPPTAVFCGDVSQLKFKISNNQTNYRYAVGLQYERIPPVYATLPGDSDSDLQINLPTRKRGQFDPSGITIFTRYPTGLFHAWGWLRFDCPILVYPKPVSRALLQEILIEQLQGDSSTSTIEGDDFAGLREHREGESLRHISWKAYAQGKGLLTKTFQGHAQPSLWIDFDQVPIGGLESKLSYMTALVLSAENSNQKYGLKLPGTRIEQSLGNAHRQTCLKLLATFRQSDFNTELSING